jgi:uncharacterized protein YndB with AHSA1/START domain
MEDLPAVERSVEIQAEPNEVWERIVHGELAEEWMGVRVEPRVGGDVLVPDREIIGTVEEVIPGESITWSWREVDGDPSQVTIDVTATRDGTRVTVTERLLEYRITGTPPVFYSMAA